MKKLFVILLTFVLLIPCSIFGIDIRKESMVQHGGMRMPSIERVSADYENGLITIAVKGYTGGVQVFVSDSQGNNIGYAISFIANEGSVSMDLDTLDEGSYSLKIVLDNASYHGQFYV
jgi:hypothetical protein